MNVDKRSLPTRVYFAWYFLNKIFAKLTSGEELMSKFTLASKNKLSVKVNEFNILTCLYFAFLKTLLSNLHYMKKPCKSEQILLSQSKKLLKVDKSNLPTYTYFVACSILPFWRNFCQISISTRWENRGNWIQLRANYHWQSQKSQHFAVKSWYRKFCNLPSFCRIRVWRNLYFDEKFAKHWRRLRAN